MTNYSNNEIDLKFGNLDQKLSSFHDLQVEILKRIETQTIKTNGRVSKHDEQISKLDDEVKFNRSEMNKYITVVVVVWALVQFGIKYFI